MKRRMLGSHFALMEGGQMLAWPILTIDDEGRILSVDSGGTGLRERPGLEWYGGLLIPGLIDIVGVELFDYERRNLNAHFAGGTVALGRYGADGDPSFPLSIPGIDSDLHPVITRTRDNYSVPVFSRIKDYCLSYNQADWIGLLSLSSDKAGGLAGLKELGAIREGNKCGIINISGADLIHMKATAQMTLKWLVMP
jgi:hypothetical protein